ncbi:hypothetical protein IFM89_006454 [Coptis chinensis]|uniref:Uncharacterized protein n=1 Tax=Coptis chinensis TaxID=261450 RepID=A0A835M7H4_9MAGN|nr:hypothetical protein IFM89_006454 [Coptis chinensis]
MHSTVSVKFLRHTILDLEFFARRPRMSSFTRSLGLEKYNLNLMRFLCRRPACPVAFFVCALLPMELSPFGILDPFNLFLTPSLLCCRCFEKFVRRLCRQERRNMVAGL